MSKKEINWNKLNNPFYLAKQLNTGVLIMTDYSKKENLLSRNKAIREKCKDCMAGQKKLIKDCCIKTCSLFPFRLGKCIFPSLRKGSFPLKKPTNE